MEIISNCAQKVPRFDAAKRLVPCTSHGALVEPATNKLCIEENNFGTEDHRFGSNAFPHTRTRRQAPPGTPFWTRSQQARSSRRASRSWPRRGTRRMSSISRRRIQPPCLWSAGAPSVRTLQRSSRSCLRVPWADALKVALLGPFDVLNGHASDPRHAGRGETHLQGVEGSESPCRARPGGHSTFGWVKESPNGSPVRACMHADLQAVLPIYWKSMACGVMQK